MSRLLRISLALCLLASFIQAQGPVERTYTVSTLPTASTHSGQTVLITDGATATDCTTGGGSYAVPCHAVSNAWSALPIGSGGGTSINSVSSDPGSPTSGQIWYRSDLGQLSYYDGSNVQRIPGSRSVSGNLTFGTLNDDACSDQTLTFTGITGSTPLTPIWPTLPSGVFGSVFPTANTATLRICNLSGFQQSIGSASYTVFTGGSAGQLGGASASTGLSDSSTLVRNNTTALQALQSPITAPIINGDLTVDGVTYANLAAAWSAAASLLSSTGTSQTIHLGPSTYTINSDLIRPANGCINLEGSAKGNTKIQAMAGGTFTKAMFVSDSSVTGNASSCQFSNFYFDANNLAPKCAIFSNGHSWQIDNVTCNNATSTDSAIDFGDSGSDTFFEAKVHDLAVGNSNTWSNGTGAVVTAAIASGAVTGYSVTSGGSGYNGSPAAGSAGPYVEVLGGGCTTPPTATATIASGAVSAVTVVSGGAGCTSAPQVFVVQLGPQNYGIHIYTNATDSTYDDVVIAALGKQYGLYNQGADSRFFSVHPYTNQPIGIYDNGGNTYYGTECDSLTQYCMSLNGPHTVVYGTQMFWNHGFFANYTNSSGFFIGGTGGTTGPYDSVISGAVCTGSQNSNFNPVMFATSVYPSHFNAVGVGHCGGGYQTAVYSDAIKIGGNVGNTGELAVRSGSNNYWGAAYFENNDNGGTANPYAVMTSKCSALQTTANANFINSSGTSTAAIGCTGLLSSSGGLQLNTSASQPACSVSTRGTFWFTPSAAGTADFYQTCQKDSSNNYSWVTAGSGSGGFSNPMTTQGDLIAGGTSGAPQRLATGTNGYVLTSNGPGTLPSYQASSGSAGSSVTMGGAVTGNSATAVLRDTKSVLDYGAKGDAIMRTDGVMAAGAPVITSATGSFASGDIGKYIQVIGAGHGGSTHADGAMTSGSNTLTSASGTFAATDVGRGIVVKGAGAGGSDLIGSIWTFTSATSVTVASQFGTPVNAGTTVSGASYYYGYMTLEATISSVQSGTQATLNTAASGSISSAIYAYGTNDGAAITSAFDAIGASGGGVVRLPQPQNCPSGATCGYMAAATDMATGHSPSGLKLRYSNIQILGDEPQSNVFCRGAWGTYSNPNQYGGTTVEIRGNCLNIGDQDGTPGSNGLNVHNVSVKNLKFYGMTNGNTYAPNAYTPTTAPLTTTGDGWDTYNHGLAVYAGSTNGNFLFDHLTFENFKGEEFFSGGGMPYPVWLTNSRMSGTNADCMSFSAADLVVVDNIFENCANAGFENGTQSNTTANYANTVRQVYRENRFSNIYGEAMVLVGVDAGVANGSYYLTDNYLDNVGLLHGGWASACGLYLNNQGGSDVSPSNVYFERNTLHDVNTGFNVTGGAFIQIADNKWIIDTSNATAFGNFMNVMNQVTIRNNSGYRTANAVTNSYNASAVYLLNVGYATGNFNWTHVTIQGDKWDMAGLPIVKYTTSSGGGFSLITGNYINWKDIPCHGCTVADTDHGQFNLATSTTIRPFAPQVSLVGQTGATTATIDASKSEEPEELVLSNAGSYNVTFSSDSNLALSSSYTLAPGGTTLFKYVGALSKFVRVW